uniref:PH01B001E05.18 protein n=1 Tax=Phyllostachys edulis TaxID=38705 RepID=L0P2P0_PHYED|nr:PH01B001E05.18 [Phyllostachys edulis]
MPPRRDTTHVVVARSNQRRSNQEVSLRSSGADFPKQHLQEGFVVNEADRCVYYRHGGGEGVILCMYVNDILIFGTNLNVIKEVKDFLSQNFEMKDLGVADVILNIKLLRGDDGGITLLQPHYAEKVLSRFGYSEYKPSPTPYDPSVLLRKNRRIARDQLRYYQIIGSLMYLASGTRPDISFAVSKLSHFVFNPGDDHWYPRVLEGYSDSNWIFNADERAQVDMSSYLEVNSSKDNMKSSRHVKRRLKSVRKMRNFGVIALDYIQTAKNLADPFTKGLSRNVIDNASREMGLRPTKDAVLQSSLQRTPLYEPEC